MTANSSAFTKKIIRDYRILKKIVDGLQAADYRIVVTIGSWDMLHVGHLRYLIKAKTYGDILIVGTDSDTAIAKYKGPHRPLIPENERIELLSYQECVDYITLVDDVTSKGRWQYGLLRTLRPDIFVAVEDSYPPQQRKVIKRFARKLVVLPRQAENTSSTDLFQKLIRMLPMLATKLDRR